MQDVSAFNCRVVKTKCYKKTENADKEEWLVAEDYTAACERMQRLETHRAGVLSGALPPDPEPKSPKPEKRRSLADDDKEDDQQSKKKKRKEKDPNAPKKAPTAFFLFMKHFRAHCGDAIAGVKASEVAKLAGVRWQDIKDTEEAEVYHTEAAALKAAHVSELAKYTARQKAEAS